MSELPTVAPGQTNVNVPHKHKGGTYLRRHLGVGAHKGDRHAARLLKSRASTAFSASASVSRNVQEADLLSLCWLGEIDAIAFLGEFVGTTLFCFFAFAGTTVASLPATSVTDSGATATQGAVQPSPNTSSLLYVALSFGVRPPPAASSCRADADPLLFHSSRSPSTFRSLRACRAGESTPEGSRVRARRAERVLSARSVFNPAISLGLALIGAHTPVRAIILTIAQVLGSIAGAGITSGLLPGCVALLLCFSCAASS